jgi:hypothetical protein
MGKVNKGKKELLSQSHKGIPPRKSNLGFESDFVASTLFICWQKIRTKPKIIPNNVQIYQIFQNRLNNFMTKFIDR